jgi:hypothetical protein
VRERSRLLDHFDDLTHCIVDDRQQLVAVDGRNLRLRLDERRIHSRQRSERRAERLEIESSAFEPDIARLHRTEDREARRQRIADEDVGRLGGRAHGGDVLPDERHPGGVLPERPLDLLVGAGRVGQHVGGDGVELRGVAAAHEFGHRPQT